MCMLLVVPTQVVAQEWACWAPYVAMRKLTVDCRLTEIKVAEYVYPDF
jgi:hypothetical protein